MRWNSLRLPPPSTVLAFRGDELPRLASCASRLQPDADRRYALTPDAIRPATGQLRVTLRAQLAEFPDLPATPRLSQIVTGFPIAGVVSQGLSSPIDHQTPMVTEGPEILFQTAPGRFVSRARKSPFKHAADLRGEAMTQVVSGRLSPPALSNYKGMFPHEPDVPCNIAFRFGSPKDGKLRGCDDVKGSGDNAMCVVRSPITLFGRGHIAEASHIVRSRPKAWAFGKVDHRAAYKFLPLRPSDSGFAAIALWSPDDENWYGRRPRTQLFGSAASVLH